MKWTQTWFFLVTMLGRIFSGPSENSSKLWAVVASSQQSTWCHDMKFHGKWSAFGFFHRKVCFWRLWWKAFVVRQSLSVKTHPFLHCLSLIKGAVMFPFLYCVAMIKFTHMFPFQYWSSLIKGTLMFPLQYCLSLIKGTLMFPFLYYWTLNKGIIMFYFLFILFQRSKVLSLSPFNSLIKGPLVFPLQYC